MNGFELFNYFIKNSWMVFTVLSLLRIASVLENINDKMKK